jgi:hypothetical protein
MDLKGKCSCNLNSSGFELGVMTKLSFVRFGLPAGCFLPVPCVAYTATLMMEAMPSREK